MVLYSYVCIHRVICVSTLSSFVRRGLKGSWTKKYADFVDQQAISPFTDARR